MIETVGAVAQLGEHLLCKQGVSGSIPLSSTNLVWTETPDDRRRPLALRSFASFERLKVREEVSLEKNKFASPR